MPTGQQYATNVPQTTLTGSINATATLMSVASSSGWPSTPFTAILDMGTSLQEPVDVTNITGTTWTVTRAIDGTVGMIHQVGATVTHGDIGRDFREARSHMDASTNVHGLTGGAAVVGTTTTQTLSGKTIAAPTFSSDATMGSGTWTGTGQLNEAMVYVSGFTGATTAPPRFIGGKSGGGPPSAAFYNTNDIAYDSTYKVFWVCTAGGSPGTWVPMSGWVNLGTVTGVSSVSWTIPSWVNTVHGIWNARTDNAVNGGYINLQFNGDTGSNYVWEQALANTATIAGQNSGGTNTFIHLGAKTAANDTANYFGTGSFTATNLQGAAQYKSVSSISNAPGSTTTGYAGVHGGTWLNTNQVTTITLRPDAGNFVAGTMFTLYGSP